MLRIHGTVVSTGRKPDRKRSPAPSSSRGTSARASRASGMSCPSLTSMPGRLLGDLGEASPCEPKPAPSLAAFLQQLLRQAQLVALHDHPDFESILDWGWPPSGGTTSRATPVSSAYWLNTASNYRPCPAPPRLSREHQARIRALRPYRAGGPFSHTPTSSLDRHSYRLTV